MRLIVVTNCYTFVTPPAARHMSDWPSLLPLSSRTAIARARWLWREYRTPNQDNPLMKGIVPDSEYGRPVLCVV